MASTAKIIANINTSKPITIFSILIFSPPFLSDSFLKERKILFFYISLYIIFGVHAHSKNTSGSEYTSLKGTPLAPKDSVFAQQARKQASKRRMLMTFVLGGLLYHSVPTNLYNNFNAHHISLEVTTSWLNVLTVEKTFRKLTNHS